ncbi:MAG: T9SS type A sorting domain-containing protein [Syntrophothermus sp.]|nr:T9SS type A sorting domain-containing protein [Ignavibacteriaceae bacterium]
MNKVTKLTMFSFSLLLCVIAAGCFVIGTITQPSTIPAMQQFTSTVVVSVEGQTDATPHYGIVGLKVPNDFTIDSVWMTGGYAGAYTFLHPDSSDREPGGQVDFWTDSLEARYPSGANMKWVVYQSNTSYLTIVDTLNVNLMVKMRAGSTLGTYQIGYFVSDAALDFTDPTYYSTSLNNSLQVVAQVPVELTSFTALQTKNGVQLNWETATETNNNRFEIERSSDNKNFVVTGTLSGKGTTTQVTKYSYTDKVNAGKYYYRLKQIDFNGSFEYSKTIEVDFSVPQDFVLSQNYPNPFNPSTTLSFGLPVQSNVTFAVYNAAGELVKTISQGTLQAGTHTFSFDASNLTTGIYFYNLSAQGIDGSEFSKTAKMLLLK